MSSELAHAPESGSSSLSAVNTQLLAHGYAKRPLDLGSMGEGDQLELLRIICDLLSSNVRNLATVDELSARHRILTYEHERLGRAASSLQAGHKWLEAEASGWKARCADAEKRLAKEEERGKALRDEAARGRKALETVRVAAGHEAKKAQALLDKALSQLARTEPARLPGLVLLNPIVGNRAAPVAVSTKLPTILGLQSKLTGKTGQAPLLEQSLKELADIRAGLQEECEAFRTVIVSTANGMREALALANGENVQFFTLPTSDGLSTSRVGHGAGTHQVASSTSHPSIADTRLRALVADVTERLLSDAPPPSATADLGADPEAEDARQRAERERERTVADLQDRVKDLQVEVECAAAREAESKRAMEELARTQVQPAPAIPLIDDTLDLRAELARQKRALDDEKRKLTDATIRFGHDRQQLEAERQAFLEERRKADVDAIRASLPDGSPFDASPGNAVASSSSTGCSGQSTWASPYKPHSPSPLSPHKRTPQRRVKAPLSRLVLEKAVREKARASATAGATARSSGASSAAGGAMTESGRRGNTLVEGAAASAGGGAGRTGGDDVAAAKRGDGALLSSSRAFKALGASTGLGKSQRKVDLSKADGVGPRTAGKARVWR